MYYEKWYTYHIYTYTAVTKILQSIIIWQNSVVYQKTKKWLLNLFLSLNKNLQLDTQARLQLFKLTWYFMSRNNLVLQFTRCVSKIAHGNVVHLNVQLKLHDQLYWLNSNIYLKGFAFDSFFSLTEE